SAGISVQTTRKWKLEQVDHPAVAPLLEYKRLARLHSANGWAWAEESVRPGPPGGRERFHPDYVVGGVVTGRWATRGGGALQLPKQVRGAVVADPGWRLVVADVAQLEPRVLAAMARDERMAGAARGGDLYQGLVDQGVIDTRDHAKVAMLGALYGATTGRSGELVPRLPRAFPRATAVVAGAAWSAPGWGAPRRSRRRRGRPPRTGSTSPAPPTTTAVSPAGWPATGGASPATSSSRAPPRSGRCAGWRTCATGCVPWPDLTRYDPTAPPPARTWSSSSTMRSSSTPRLTSPRTWRRRSARPRPARAGCSSATSPSTSRSTSRSSTPTPTPADPARPHPPTDRPEPPPPTAHLPPSAHLPPTARLPPTAQHPA